MAVDPEGGAEIQDLLQDSRDRVRTPLTGRPLAVEGGLGVVLLALTVVLAIAGGTEGFDVLLAGALVAGYALASRQRLELGAGVTDPSLVIVVPMLLLQPPAVVPLLVIAGQLSADAPAVVRGERHPSRLLLALSNSWFSVGPALVLTLADIDGPSLDDWPLLLLALAVQFAVDLVVGVLAETLTDRVRPRLQLAVLLRVWALDALLAPVGLLVAYAAREDHYVWLLGLPLLVVFAGLARERAERITNALALSASRTETLGAVSHGLQRPVASIVGFAGVLRRANLEGAPGMAAEQLERDAQELRHRLRQALDYIAIRAGRELAVTVREVDVDALVAEVAAQHAGRVTLRSHGAPLLATTDRARLRQVLLNLLDNALATGTPVALRVWPVPDAVCVEVRDEGSGLPPDVLADPFAERPREAGADETAGAGIGLVVSGAIAGRVGLEIGFVVEGGTTVTVRVPRS